MYAILCFPLAFPSNSSLNFLLKSSIGSNIAYIRRPDHDFEHPTLGERWSFLRFPFSTGSGDDTEGEYDEGCDPLHDMDTSGLERIGGRVTGPSNFAATSCVSSFSMPWIRKKKECVPNERKGSNVLLIDKGSIRNTFMARHTNVSFLFHLLRTVSVSPTCLPSPPHLLKLAQPAHSYAGDGRMEMSPVEICDAVARRELTDTICSLIRRAGQ